MEDQLTPVNEDAPKPDEGVYLVGILLHDKNEKKKVSLKKNDGLPESMISPKNDETIPQLEGADKYDQSQFRSENGVNTNVSAKK